MNRLIPISLVAIVIIAVAYYFNSQEKPLPIYDATDVKSELIDPEARQAGPHRIGSWALTDQAGQLTTEKELEGKVYVADFFFTTCQSICPIMTGQMWKVSQAYSDDERVKFRSFSVLPDEDTVEVLANYAASYEIDHDQWRLITGDKKDIYSLARRSFFTLKEAEVGKGDGGSSDFIHTNNFVLVDWQARIRGYYDGTSVSDIERLTDDIARLLREGEREGVYAN